MLYSHYRLLSLVFVTKSILVMSVYETNKLTYSLALLCCHWQTQTFHCFIIAEEITKMLIYKVIM